MRGANALRKTAHTLDGTLLVLQGQPFLTIQGEGPYAGLPATFIRLWGCVLACTWCDTDFESDPQPFSVKDLVSLCASTELVVLTGGEPLRQNIAPLVRALQRGSHRVQIETFGGLWLEELDDCMTALPPLTVVVSPKTPHVHYKIDEHAEVWKYIVSTRMQLDPDDDLPITDTQGKGHPRKLARPKPDVLGTQIMPEYIYVQPLDEGDPIKNKANTALCVEIAKRRGYRVSLQQHKILGVP